MARRLESHQTRYLAGVAAVLLGGAILLRPGEPRALSAETLARLRTATPAGMVLVPAGPFRMGSNDPDADEDARPMRRVSVGSFYIGRTEVTNAEFRRFRPSFQYPQGHGDYPVTKVTYDDAAVYCRWAG